MRFGAAPKRSFNPNRVQFELLGRSLNMSRGLRMQESKILPFRPPAERTRRPVDLAGGLGTVLLFTGVRYERMVDAPLTERPEETNSADDRRLDA